MRENVFFLGLLLGIALMAGWETNTVNAAPDELLISKIYQFKDDRPFEYVSEVGSGLFPILSKGNVTLGVKGKTELQIQVTRQLFMQIPSEKDPIDFIRGLGVSISEDLGEGFFLLDSDSPEASLEAASLLSKDQNVYSASPIMKWPMAKLESYSPYPKDPYFSEQKHLENRDANGRKLGIDLNVRSAWPIARGKGISIGVVDDGIQTTHPDLEESTKGQPHHDYVKNVSHVDTPPPINGFHGTNVAGISAARGDNNIGISGVAPDANLTSLLIFGSESFEFASDINLARLFRHETHRVQVQNHSWASGTEVLSGPGRLVSQSITNAVRLGRNTLGAIIVRSAGNFRDPSPGHPGNGNVNDDRYPSDPHVITVAASDRDGKATSYSSPGAPILVAAPSGDSVGSDEGEDTPGIMTTDLVGVAGANPARSSAGRPDYSFGSSAFDGTSASAPEIAGLAALILSARSDLHYRDVQQILAMSAKQHYDDPHTQLNGGGFEVNDNVGFGIPDAGVAVRLAKDWESRPRYILASYSKSLLMEIGEGEYGIKVSPSGAGEESQWISGYPSLGPVNDRSEKAGKLAFVGLANQSINLNLENMGALIQRGEVLFRDKILRAEEAGAEFSIIYNNAGNAPLIMASTDYTSIPTIFIGEQDGEDLKQKVLDNPDLEVKLQMRSKSATFDVRDEMIVEYIGLEFESNISRRSGIRITLFSPSGTKSELQSINQDNVSGLSSWTFHSAQHMFEPSKGTWRVQVSNLGDSESSGTVTSLKLLIRGVTISDDDADGLDDDWEVENFETFDYTALDDPDEDGFRNGYEQAAGTDPKVNDRPFILDLNEWKEGMLRLSWPGNDNAQYDIFSSLFSPNQFGKIASVDGRFPITDTVISIGAKTMEFFRVLEKPNR